MPDRKRKQERVGPEVSGAILNTARVLGIDPCRGGTEGYRLTGHQATGLVPCLEPCDDVRTALAVSPWYYDQDETYQSD